MASPLWIKRNGQCLRETTLYQSYPEQNKVTCVCAHVYLQKCSAVELLVAVLAIVLLLALHLSCMRTQMLSQIVLATEHASTHLQANACKLWDESTEICVNVHLATQLKLLYNCNYDNPATIKQILLPVLCHWHRVFTSLPDMGVRGVGCHHTLSGLHGAPDGTCGWTASCSVCMSMASVLQHIPDSCDVWWFKAREERKGDHWNSCSPVCVYMWRARVPLSGQRASHSGQEYVSPSKWITRRCRSRLDFSLKFFAQSTHSKSPPCKHKTFWTSQHKLCDSYPLHMAESRNKNEW
jgi:hypothetical protein